MQQGAGGGGRGPEESIFYKTRLCTQFMSTGHCSHGPTCKYAHGEHEIRQLSEEGQQILNRMEASRARQAGGSEQRDKAPAGPGNRNKGPRDESLRKTEMCHDFQAGRCQYGDRCFYAHSMDELRPAAPGSGPGPGAQGGAQPMGMDRSLPGPPPLGGPGGPMMPGMGPNVMSAAAAGMPGMMGMPGMAGMGMPGMPGMAGPMPGMLQAMQQSLMQPGGMPGMMPGMQPQGNMGMGPPPGGMQPAQPPNRPELPKPPGADASAAGARGKPTPPSGPPRLAGGETPRGQKPAAAAATTPAGQADGAVGLKGAAPATKAGAASAGDAGSGPMVDPSVRAEVAYIERVRATCGILNIGNASVFSKERPELVKAALAAARSRAAYRANAYADDVSGYLPQPAPAARAAEAART